MQVDHIKHILFLDIETVPLIYDYHEAPEKIRKLFEKKVRYRLKDDTTAEDLYEQAGIWAEFGKVVAVAIGVVTVKNGKNKLVIKKIGYDDEKKVLTETAEILRRFSEKHGEKTRLCAHNGKEFDFPYLARRMLINRIPLPEILKVHGKKPWETPYCDTMELWQFGDRKHYTSLELLTEILDIPSPKYDLDGSDVARVYYEEKDLERIKQYCASDVAALVNVYLRLHEQDIIPENDIEIQD